jgi:hypothetical protein
MDETISPSYPCDHGTWPPSLFAGNLAGEASQRCFPHSRRWREWRLPHSPSTQQPERHMPHQHQQSAFERDLVRINPELMIPQIPWVRAQHEWRSHSKWIIYCTTKHTAVSDDHYSWTAQHSGLIEMLQQTKMCVWGGCRSLQTLLITPGRVWGVRITSHLTHQCLHQVSNCHSRGNGVWVDDQIRTNALSSERHVFLLTNKDPHHQDTTSVSNVLRKIMSALMACFSSLLMI